MAIKTTDTVTMDSKGRLLIPEAIRTELKLESGDVFFLQRDEKSGTMQLAKAINPFELMVQAAIAEDDAGLTVSIKEAWRMIDAGELDGE